MKLAKAQIFNLYSYQDEGFIFEDYNIIVGPNASGKTNLIRILEILNGAYDIQSIKLERRYRHNVENPSYLHLECWLYEDEIKMLFQLIFNKSIHIPPVYKIPTKIILVISWPKTSYEYARPNFVLLRFANGFTIWKMDDEENMGYIDHVPEHTEILINLIRKSKKITDNEENIFRQIHGFNSGNLLQNDKFEKSLLEENDVGEFFTINKSSITLPFPTNSVSYDHSNPREHQVEMLKFCNLDLNAQYRIYLWFLFEQIIKKSIHIIKEIRLDLEALSNDLFRLKTEYNFQKEFNEIHNAFLDLFPSVEFDVFPMSNSPDNNRYYILIREGEKEYNLKDSASGYVEALYLFSKMGDYKNDILIIDEPSLHLHPIKIKQLGKKLLSIIKRQIIIITHSPYLIDYSLFTRSRNLIYIKKDADNKSTIVNKPSEYNLDLKSYLFKPDIFFSSCTIFVEGASDASCLIAISDALDSIFERYNILVAELGGKDTVAKYNNLLSTYQLPYVAMVDQDYKGNRTTDFFVLDNKLEYELKK
jgi:predicted ATP-dependent endonuclease of OLD family